MLNRKELKELLSLDNKELINIIIRQQKQIKELQEDIQEIEELHNRRVEELEEVIINDRKNIVKEAEDKNSILYMLESIVEAYKEDVDIKEMEEDTDIKEI